MARITVEGIPDGLLARLRLAAIDSGRSLSGEVIVQLVRSAACSKGGRVEGPLRVGAPCAVDGSCRCAARRMEARTVGWGGPVRPD